MKNLNSRQTAWLITVVLMFIGFLAGGARPLNKLRNQAQQVFLTGTENSGPNSFNITDDLRKYAGLAANALVTAGKYYNDSSKEITALKDARTALNDALGESAVNAGKLHSALENTRTAEQNLSALILNNNAVSSVDIALYNGNSVEMASLFTIITREGAVFNQNAETFNERLVKIPAVFFRITGLVKPVRLFNN